MSVKALILGAAVLAWAAPATAQQRGTMEFGAFGSALSFDNSLSLTKGYGWGGRVGMYLSPRLSIEGEGSNAAVDRPNGLKGVNVGIISARLVATIIKSGPFSVHLGAGVPVSTETFFLHTYGADALVGAKFALGENLAFRVDGVMDWLTNTTPKWRTYKSVHAGFSYYRHPSQAAAVTVMAPAGPAPRPDTVRVTVTREVAPPLPTGQAASICLATGENMSVLLTAQGDTLVGPSRASMRDLRQGGVVFAGEYAQGRTWFDKDEALVFEKRSFRKSDGEQKLNCPDLQRVGDYQGVALFARRDAKAPYLQLYVPVRLGIWQMYENLRQTRG